jgi:hypothetical protein
VGFYFFGLFSSLFAWAVLWVLGLFQFLVFSCSLFLLLLFYKMCLLTYQRKNHMLKFSEVMVGFSQAFATLEVGVRKITLSFFFFFFFRGV